MFSFILGIADDQWGWRPSEEFFRNFFGRILVVDVDLNGVWGCGAYLERRLGFEAAWDNEREFEWGLIHLELLVRGTVFWHSPKLSDPFNIFQFEKKTPPRAWTLPERCIMEPSPFNLSKIKNCVS